MEQNDPWKSVRRSNLYARGAPLLFSLIGMALYYPLSGNVVWVLGLSFVITASLQVFLPKPICPVCGQDFITRGIFNYPTTDKCVHCGVEIGSPLK